MHLTTCICTYRRPVWLARLLRSLIQQETRGCFTHSVVVTDNDVRESAREVVADAARFALPMIYAVESRRSISHARNRSVALATGDAIVFIDDDEVPERDWLYHLWSTWVEYQVAGVLGPVRPLYARDTPEWVIRGGFYHRAEHPTGYLMPWSECRTGNALLDRQVIRALDPVFLPEFGTGGSDVDFFRRMINAGHRFIWCSEAIVHEVVPPNRWKRTVLLQRALLRGQNSYRHPEGRSQSLAKGVLAVPLYILALPFLFVLGHHYFMRYLVKLCDHLGRLLAAIGVQPVKQRAM
jgi:glycosyltransferase involved in cell wall biosynthesis